MSYFCIVTCVIGPNIPTLTINNGLGRAVELHCQCMYVNGMMITGTRWFRGNSLVGTGTSQNNPHYIAGVPSRLIFPFRFRSHYDGTYTCSPDDTFPTGSSGDTIALNAGSEYVAIYC